MHYSANCATANITANAAVRLSDCAVFRSPPPLMSQKFIEIRQTSFDPRVATPPRVRRSACTGFTNFPLPACRTLLAYLLCSCVYLAICINILCLFTHGLYFEYYLSYQFRQRLGTEPRCTQCVREQATGVIITKTLTINLTFSTTLTVTRILLYAIRNM